MVGVFDCGPTGQRLECVSCLPEHFDSPIHDWVIKDLACPAVSCCATGHINDPVSLIEMSRASYPGGRFPPSFIHQVIIITGLNNYDCMFSP